MANVTEKQVKAALKVLQLYDRQQNPPLSDLSLGELRIKSELYRSQFNYFRSVDKMRDAYICYDRLIEIDNEIQKKGGL